MTDWCHSRLSVIGKPEHVSAFVEKAEGKDLLWKDGKGPPHLGQVTVPLSFHALVPLRDHEIQSGYDPYGIEEEKRQWGCKWSAFETEMQRIDDGHAFYEFETASRPPVNLLKTCSADLHLKFFVSYYADVYQGRRGRGIYFRHEVYALGENSPLTEGKTEAAENFILRRQLWMKEHFENHLDWVQGMIE